LGLCCTEAAVSLYLDFFAFAGMFTKEEDFIFTYFQLSFYIQHMKTPNCIIIYNYLRIFLNIIFIVFFCQISHGQSVQTIQFTPPVFRAPLNLPPGTHLIRVGNLAVGHTYSFIPVATFPWVKAQFKTTFADKKMETVAKTLTPPDRPQWRRMQMDGTDVLLVVEVESSTEETPVSFSINCEDCPRSTLWLDKFKDAVESVNIQTTPGVSATSLITNTLIGGDCFEVAGITATGNVNSRGTFNNGTASIGIQTGAVLCTGHVNIIPGPNNSQNANNGFGFNSPDDPDLATLSNGNQFDLSRIVFEFTPTSDLVQFDYVFASEEYCEFDNTNFNDVFGFFISGPGITGKQNIALIPDTNTPITINNVNHVNNTQYYVNNNTWNPCQTLNAYAPDFNQFDGFTTVLTATAKLIPCETYQIKLAIADIADQAYASAIFLKANSFNASGTIKCVPEYPAGQNFVYEGCNNGFIRFTRSGDLSQPFVVNYSVGGSAVPGDDYIPLPTSVTIPANQSFVQIPISVLADTITEGLETFTIILENACRCELKQITFNIQDLDPLKVETKDNYICGIGIVTLESTVEGGILPYKYLWSSGHTTSMISIATSGITEYTLTVTDNCGATATASVTVVEMSTIQPTVTVFPTYGFSDGVAQADYTGGAAPVAISWSNGATGATLSGVPPGAYTITLTDANGCSASATVELPPVARGAVHWSADPDQGIKDVTVRQSGSVADVRITGADGLYSFDPTSTSALLTLTPEKTTGKLLGVTAADATRIRRHVVLMDTLEAPYQLIAGDVSGNNQISTLDAVLLVQCLLANPAACNQWIASWRFVDAAHTFTNPLSPWGFPERIQLSPGVLRTGSGLDFTGIKVGDVVISDQIPQLRLPPLVLRGADVQLRAGEQIETKLQVYGYEDVTAFQLALDYDPALLQLEAVETPAGGLLEPGDFGPWTASPGSLRAARVDLQGVSLENGSPFFTLRFRAQESGAWLSDALAIDTTALQSEAYKSDLTPQPVLLELQRASSAEDITSGRLSLRVQPNPAKASAALWFTLPEASEAHIRVLDATGRIIQAHRGWYGAGTYERRLDFPSAGLYVVQVATQQGMESVRVIAAGR
jgi:hypothetical protein